MKLQGLSIIFGLIVIPMVLVLSYYIQLQVDTIALQSSYDTKLLNATHGAMAAFEMNTANEDLSSVADSLRTIIDASNSIFFNTLATDLRLSNASKSYIEPYVPAVLYTLYDGYYISSPTKKPQVATTDGGQAIEIDENTATNYTIVGDTIKPEDYGQLLYKSTEDGMYTKELSKALYKTENVLKSYMPYSARYIVNESDPKTKIDVTINYTLDNYLNIEGNIGEVYYTKSGYLIKEGLVEFDPTSDFSGYNENDAETEILALAGEREFTIKVNGIEIKSSDGEDEKKAVIYYTKAKLFSDWVYENLGSIRQRDIQEDMTNKIIGTSSRGTEDIIYNFDGKDDVIFNKDEDPESDSSIFVNHKFNVIRNSIQYNLNLAMSTYNEGTVKSYDFNMPIISNDEWLKIINNVSIVSFFQGIKCGLKTYNNYAIVSSTNNELTVIPDEIYYTDSEKFIGFNTNPDYSGDTPVYHRIDCPRLKEEGDIKLTSFVSKEVKYDSVYDKTTDKHNYDHKSLACYTCIIDGNYKPEIVEEVREKAKYVAIGKERYDVYKMNAIKYSEGYEILYDKEGKNPINSSSNLSKLNLKKIKRIDITFGTIPTTDFGENTVTIKFGSDLFEHQEFTLNTNQAKEQTISIVLKNSSSESHVSYSDLEKLAIVNSNSTVQKTDLQKFKLIKIIYK